MKTLIVAFVFLSIGCLFGYLLCGVLSNSSREEYLRYKYEQSLHEKKVEALKDILLEINPDDDSGLSE